MIVIHGLKTIVTSHLTIESLNGLAPKISSFAKHNLLKILETAPLRFRKFYKKNTEICQLD